ncbi:MAG: thiazole synthase [Candidatus Muiribacteriota bacterium]
MGDLLEIGGEKFSSRLILGTGKYPSDDILRKCIVVSKVELVTVCVRRVELDNPDRGDILKVIDKKKVKVIPNTSGAVNAKQAVRIAKAAKFSGISDWIKVEVVPDSKNLLPDPVETYKACYELIEEGFKVLPYIGADPVLARKLENIGCVAVMPLAAPIGTGKGVLNKEFLKIIISQANVPVIIDAGIGKLSHACEAVELGADGIMLNTAVSSAKNPVNMAKAFSDVITAAFKGKKAGFINEGDYAVASSEIDNILEEIEQF